MNMERNNLPMTELKEYGIINEDNSFSNKLSANDVKDFLKGAIIVADNNKDRITFQLTDDNSKLKVQQFHREKAIQSLLEDSKKEIQYVKQTPINSEEKAIDDKIAENIKVFVYDEKKQNVVEYDLLKDIKKLTQIVAERQKVNEVNRYKVELQKLMSFIQDKIDKFPEFGKQLTENLNIVSNEMHSVNSISAGLNKKAENSKIEYDVNDPDLYQDANRKREEEQEDKRRGRRR